MTVPVPSEDQEQIWFVQWLDEQGIPYWHTNNEMWTKSWKQKNRAKAMGVKSGIPDLFLCFDGKLVGIEMKKTKGGVVSDNQKYWGTILEAAGIPCFVCRGNEHAQETVQELLASGEVKMMPKTVIENAEKLKEMSEKKKKERKISKNDCPF